MRDRDPRAGELENQSRGGRAVASLDSPSIWR